MVSQEIYSRCKPELRECVFWFDRDSFVDLGVYLKISLPNTIMMCAEWWAFELIIFMASFLSVEELDAQIILINLHYLFFTIPKGCQEAISTLVGNCIGKGDWLLGKRYFKVPLAFSSLILFVILLVLWLSKNSIVHMYT